MIILFFFFSFLHQNAEIHEFTHFIDILAWFCINFVVSWLKSVEIQDVGSKMADDIAPFDVAWRHYQRKWYNLQEQARSYLIKVNVFRSASTARKPRGSFHAQPTLYLGRVWVSLYSRGLDIFKGLFHKNFAFLSKYISCSASWLHVSFHKCILHICISCPREPRQLLHCAGEVWKPRLIPLVWPRLH